MRKLPEQFTEKPRTVAALQFDGANFDDVIGWLPEKCAWKSGESIQLHLDHGKAALGEIGKTAMVKAGMWVLDHGASFEVLSDEQFQKRYSK